MRSVVVVLPASTCAMMPMLRMSDRAVVRGIADFRYRFERAPDPGRECLMWRQVRGFEGVWEFWGAQISRKSVKSRAVPAGAGQGVGEAAGRRRRASAN